MASVALYSYTTLLTSPYAPIAAPTSVRSGIQLTCNFRMFTATCVQPCAAVYHISSIQPQWDMCGCLMHPMGEASLFRVRARKLPLKISTSGWKGLGQFRPAAPQGASGGEQVHFGGRTGRNANRFGPKISISRSKTLPNFPKFRAFGP
jgi:hypothetical protein